MKKLLFVFMMFFACIGLVNADSSYYSKLWEFKQGNSSTNYVDQMIETKDGYLLVGSGFDGIDIRLVDENAKLIKKVELDGDFWGNPFKILYKDGYYLILYDYDNYLGIIILDEEYNYDDYLSFDIGDYPGYYYRMITHDPIFFEDDNYYYISSLKFDKHFNTMTPYTENEAAQMVSDYLGMDAATVADFMSWMHDDESIFVRSTPSNGLLGSWSTCGPVALGAGAYLPPLALPEGLRNTDACYAFYTYEDNDYKFLKQSNDEVVYDAIEYEGNIIALLYDMDEEEAYMVVFDWDGNELSRESLDNYNVSKPGKTYLRNTSDGFILVSPKTGSCGFRGAMRETVCYSNVTYFSQIFNISTKTDGNGEINVEKIRVSTGEAVKFTVTPKEGYVLNAVKVIDSKGNVVTFKNNTFVMPASDVIVEATFSPINPLTSTGGIIWTVITMMLLAIFVGLKFRKRLHWLN